MLRVIKDVCEGYAWWVNRGLAGAYLTLIMTAITYLSPTSTTTTPTAYHTYLSGVDPKALVEPERRRACAEDQDEAGGGAAEEIK